MQYSSDCGLVFVAIFSSAYSYVQTAISRAKLVMPDIPVTLFCDKDLTGIYYNHFVLIEPNSCNGVIPKYPSSAWFTKAMHMFGGQYKYNLYMDIDTWIVEPIYEVFDLLDKGKYDLAMCYDMGTRNIISTHADTPAAQCNFNAGVVAYTNSEKLTKFNQHFIDLSFEYANRTRGYADEPHLARAVYDCDYMRYAALPHNYNCRFIFPYMVRDRVKVLHGRCVDYNVIANAINSNDGYRVGQEDKFICRYDPGIGFTKLI